MIVVEEMNLPGGTPSLPSVTMLPFIMLSADGGKGRVPDSASELPRTLHREQGGQICNKELCHQFDFSKPDSQGFNNLKTKQKTLGFRGLPSLLLLGVWGSPQR